MIRGNLDKGGKMNDDHTDIGKQVAYILLAHIILLLLVFLLKSSRPQRTPNPALTNSGSCSVPVEMSGRVRSGSGTHSRWPL